jgi:hypothetical protein
MELKELKEFRVRLPPWWTAIGYERQRHGRSHLDVFRRTALLRASMLQKFCVRKTTAARAGEARTRLHPKQVVK